MKTGVYVQVFSLGRLAFNITKHKMVPKLRKLGELDKQRFLDDHNLDSESVKIFHDKLYESGCHVHWIKTK